MKYKNQYGDRLVELFSHDLVANKITAMEMKKAAKLKWWQKLLLKVNIKIWKVKSFVRYVLAYGKERDPDDY